MTAVTGAGGEEGAGRDVVLAGASVPRAEWPCHNNYTSEGGSVPWLPPDVLKCFPFLLPSKLSHFSSFFHGCVWVLSKDKSKARTILHEGEGGVVVNTMV